MICDKNTVGFLTERVNQIINLSRLRENVFEILLCEVVFAENKNLSIIFVIVCGTSRKTNPTEYDAETCSGQLALH